jgi:hypothetical protein
VGRWHEHAGHRLRAAAPLGTDGAGVLTCDGTDTQRGGLAKVANTRRYGKRPQRGQRGRPTTPTHTFLLGLLVPPCGLRRPLPRKSWLTRAYAKAQGQTCKSRVELAEELLTWLRPLRPAATPLVGRADSLFGGRRLAVRMHPLTYYFKFATCRRSSTTTLSPPFRLSMSCLVAM